MADIGWQVCVTNYSPYRCQNLLLQILGKLRNCIPFRISFLREAYGGGGYEEDSVGGVKKQAQHEGINFVLQTQISTVSFFLFWMK